MSRKDDFMDYVGYNLYGGGNDPNFQRSGGSSSGSGGNLWLWVVGIFVVGWIVSWFG